MASRWFQNDFKVIPAWVQNQPKTDLKSSKNFQVSDIRSLTSGLRSQRSETLKLGLSFESLGFSSDHLSLSSEKLGFSSDILPFSWASALRSWASALMS